MNNDTPPDHWSANHIIRYNSEDGKNSWALFSPDEAYRYRLRRTWENGARACFLMLNPSTADEMKNDPTVARCESRARRLGFGGFEVVNIFALRSTDPKGLYKADDPVGAKNDLAIKEAIASTDKLVCAWGAHGGLNERSDELREIIMTAGVRAFHLGLTKKGEPKHPLYISNETSLTEWNL